MLTEHLPTFFLLLSRYSCYTIKIIFNTKKSFVISRFLFSFLKLFHPIHKKNHKLTNYICILALIFIFLFTHNQHFSSFNIRISIRSLLDHLLFLILFLMFNFCCCCIGFVLADLKSVKIWLNLNINLRKIHICVIWRANKKHQTGKSEASLQRFWRSIGKMQFSKNKKKLMKKNNSNAVRAR